MIFKDSLYFFLHEAQFLGADQLLPQLSMEQFDTLPSQYRHIEYMHEGVWFRKNNF